MSIERDICCATLHRCPSCSALAESYMNLMSKLSIKRKQCQAFASSTKMQCTKFSFRGSKYCWHHQSKLPVFAALLVGIITSLLIPKIWESVFPSKVLKQIESNTDQIPILAQDINTAVETIHSVEDIRTDVKKIVPFELNKAIRHQLETGIRNLIQHEREHNLPETQLQFILFSQQSPEASELVRFIRSVFKANQRESNITMAMNSGIPPNLRGFIFKVKDPKNAPALSRPFLDMMKELKFKICIVHDKRMPETELQVSAQMPYIMDKDS